MLCGVARLREFDTEAAVQAAMTAFRQHGYEGTSIQDLVEATGVGRGSLYAAFGSKEGLYLAAVDRYREQYATPLIELLHDGSPAREVIREVLVAVIDEIVRDGNRLACLIVSAAMERVADDPETARRVRTTTESLEDALTEIIAAGQAAGELDGERDARDLARFVVTTLQGLRVMGAINSDRRSLMAAAEVAVGALG
jgi:TetR/AcrR family transcriptional regulator, transcriptional repressor for nem operon